MKINLEINNLAKVPIKKDFFKVITKKTLENSGYNPPAGGKNISLSLAVVGKTEIKKLNKTYRKKNEPTDVLSFAEYKNTRELRSGTMRSEKEIFLGEVILCYDDIKEYASKKGININKELAAVTTHGVLHLLGMRHGKKMFEMQREISDAC